jgi:hypothetical protein
MQNHPAAGDPRFAEEFLNTISQNVGSSSEPPPRRRQPVRRLRQFLASLMRRAADRIEARPVRKPTLSDGEC